jgi:pimeloyl-ACP methyl ester carboxylesterase/class 3 adenylate cyclase
MEQQLGYCSRADSARIAYATAGSGSAMVYVRPLFAHLERDWEFGELRRYYEDLAAHHTLIRYDRHGTGLSDRERKSFTLADELADLELVADHLGLTTLDLVGDASGGPIAIAYAAQHPDRVRRLILYGTFAYGPELGSLGVRDALVGMIRANYRLGSRTFAEIVLPGADARLVDIAAGIMRDSADVETAASLFELTWAFDVRHALPSITCPTLVLHRRGDMTAPIELGKDLASQITGAHFEELEGAEAPPYVGDTRAVLRAIASFLDDPEPGDADRQAVTILATEMYRLVGDEPEEPSRERVRRRKHDNLIRDVLREHGGRELKHSGTGITAAFGVAAAAVAAAAQIQRRFADWRSREPMDAIRVRIGLVAGEIAAGEVEELNEAFALTQRVCLRAEPDEVLATDEVRRLALRDSFGFVDAGNVVLDGVRGPRHLHAVRWET